MKFYGERMDLERLASQLTIDLTTIGRKTGEPRRIEIWWFRFEDRFIITGTPGPRDWLANIQANPNVVIHVDGQDLMATAEPVDDAEFRRRFFEARQASWYKSQAGLERLVGHAPMVEVTF